MLALVCVGLAHARQPAPHAQPDRRLSPVERELASRAVGHALPDLEQFARWLPEPGPGRDELAGRIIVLQSWTISTEAGRAAPKLAAEALEEFADEEVLLIALHTPQGSNGVEKHLQSSPVQTPILLDATGELCDMLGLWRKPTIIVADQNGVVRAGGVSLDALAETVRELIEDPAPASATPPSVVPPRASPGPKQSRQQPPGGATYPPVTGVVSGKDLRNLKGPKVEAQTWLTPLPDLSNKVVIIDFWATWCGPCVASIPHMNKLAEKFKDNVVALAISDEPASTITSFIERRKISFGSIVGSDQRRRMMSAFAPRGIPHCAIMSPDGVVRWQGHPMQIDDALVQRIIDASAAEPAPTMADEPAEAKAIRWVKPTR